MRKHSQTTLESCWLCLFVSRSLKTLLVFVGVCTILGFMVSFLYDARHERSAFAAPPPPWLKVPCSHGEISLTWTFLPLKTVHHTQPSVCVHACVYAFFFFFFLLKSHTVPPGTEVCVALAVETFHWKVDPFSLRMSTRAVSMGSEMKSPQPLFSKAENEWIFAQKILTNMYSVSKLWFKAGSRNASKSDCSRSHQHQEHLRIVLWGPVLPQWCHSPNTVINCMTAASVDTASYQRLLSLFTQ